MRKLLFQRLPCDSSGKKVAQHPTPTHPKNGLGQDNHIGQLYKTFIEKKIIIYKFYCLFEPEV